MKLEDAKSEAAWVISKFNFLCDQLLVVGSIRREKSEVNDIDIVVAPLAPGDENWDQIAKELRHASGMEQVKKGPKLMTFAHRKEDALGATPDYTVDIYRATPETWGILCLVRTGSKEHNVKLCNIALGKGMKLSAAEGVLKPLESFPSMIKIIASKTEEEIFAALGLAYVEPKDREV